MNKSKIGKSESLNDVASSLNGNGTKVDSVSGNTVNPVPLPADELMVAAFQLYGIMFVVSLVFSYLFQGKFNLWPGSFTKLAIGLSGGVLLGLLISIISRILIFFPRWKKLFFGFRKILGHLSVKDVLILALMSGFGEEAFFRGFLQPWLGIPAASFFFAVLHAPQLFSSDQSETSSLSLWPWFALAAGIALGWLTILTGTWLSSAVAHFLVNYLNLVYICSVCDCDS
jgi:membrane protease YdiL (CAAX protease family)